MSDLTITDVETYIVACPTRPWVFVTVTTDTGIQGVGEAMAQRKPETIATAIAEMSERYVIGEDPFATEELFFRMYRDEWFSKNIINTAVISAIDSACWDIKGRYLDMPVYELLGGSVHGDTLPAYANGWLKDADSDPEGFADAAEMVVNDGYQAMKFDPFGAAWERMTRRELNRSLEKVEAVRNAVGPDIDLLIEGHGRFTPGMAIEVSEKLKEYDITFFEEPTPADSVSGLRRVSEESTIPIATGERAMTKYDARDLLAETEIDFIQTDLANTGGITESKKIASMAEAEHVTFAPHNSQGPVSTAMCVHVCAATPNFMFQEAFEEYDVEWKTDLLETPLEITDGEIEIPDRPGLGVGLDMDVVQQHNFEQHRDRVNVVNPFESGWESRSLGDD